MANDYRITLDGVSSDEAGILIFSPLKLSAPVPRVKKFTVPGRNGDVYISDGSYENRTATVQACLYEGRENFYVKSKIAYLNEWLFSSTGYRKLVTADDPLHYLMARVANGPEIEAKATNEATFTIKFDCKPQRYLNKETDVVVGSRGIIFSSGTSFPTKPLLKIVYSSGSSGRFTLNGVTMTVDIIRLISLNAPSTIYYDVETEQTYSISSEGAVTEYVDVISGAANIAVIPGENNASVSGLDSVTITPRGWNL